MKKRFALLAMAFAALAAFGAETRMYVSCKNGCLKQKASYFAKKNCDVSYGEVVIVMSTSGKWTQVKAATNSLRQGWISTSSLSKRQILTGKSNVSANASEIALAGKGFSAEVENLYKNNGSTNYAAVDTVESNAVKLDSIQGFIKEGKLNGGEE